jgi:hypothetical protein
MAAKETAAKKTTKLRTSTLYVIWYPEWEEWAVCEYKSEITPGAEYYEIVVPRPTQNSKAPSVCLGKIVV